MASEEFSAQPGEEVAREEAPAADFSSEGDDEGRAAVFDEEGAEAEDEFEAAEEGRLDTASPPPEEAAGGEGGGEEGLGEEEGYEEEEFDEQAAAETEQVHARGALLEEVPELSAEVAEVVLVTTSLGSIKRQFFASKRLQHFLDCKGVVYCSVDCNRDLSTAMNLKDVELFKEWRSLGILKTIEDPDKDPSEQEVLLPQVLIDGVAVGGEAELQDLEEDGDLDWIFARAACPSCLHEKPTDATSCPSCGAVFSSLIPAELLANGGVQQMLQGYSYNSTEEESGGLEPKERWASGLQQADFEMESLEKRQDE